MRVVVAICAATLLLAWVQRPPYAGGVPDAARSEQRLERPFSPPPEDTRTALQTIATSADEPLRVAIQEAFAQMSSIESWEGISMGLIDPSEAVRVAAVEALGRRLRAGEADSRESDAVEHLAMALHDEAVSVRDEAAIALLASGDSTALEYLRAAGDDPQFAAHDIAFVLARFADAQGQSD